MNPRKFLIGSICLILALICGLVLSPKGNRHSRESQTLINTSRHSDDAHRKASGAPGGGMLPVAHSAASSGVASKSTPIIGASASEVFPHAEMLAEREVVMGKASSPRDLREIKRIKILKTDFKYPLIRSEERIQRNPMTGEERRIERRDMVANHLIVKLQPDRAVSDLQPLNASWGAHIERTLVPPRTFIVAFNNPDPLAFTQILDAYNSRKDLVAYAEPNFVSHARLMPNDPGFSTLWGMNNTGQTGGVLDSDIDAVEAWNHTQGSHNVIVAIIDSGMDYNHPDLAANVWVNAGEIPGNGIDDDGNGYTDDVHGWDFYEADPDPMDDHLHGTHVAGTIGAVGNNGQGIAGVAWKVKMMPLKFLNHNGSGVLSDAIMAIDYAGRMKARICNNSWGGGGYSESLREAIDNLGARGGIFIASAGNAADDTDVIEHFPSGYTSANVISVAATDHTDQLAWFSNYGARSVDLAAPGHVIYSTLPTFITPKMTEYGLSAHYGTLSGTSMAAPHVSGALALILARNSNLTVSQLKYRLKERSDKFDSFAYKMQFSGRLNAFEMINPKWKARPPRLVLLKNVVHEEGNKNQQYEAGETIRFHPSFKNLGTLAATNVYARVIALNPEVSVLTAPQKLPNIGQLTEITPGAPFKIKLGASLVGNETLLFEYLLTYNTGLETRIPFELSLAAVGGDPDLRLGFPVKVAVTGGTYRAGPGNHILVANIDADANPEIVFSGIANGPLYAIHYGGNKATIRQMDDYPGTYYAAAGKLSMTTTNFQIFAGSYFRPGSMGAYKEPFKFLPGWPLNAVAYVSAPPTLADLDGDGVDEALFSQGEGYMHAMKMDGSEAPGWPVPGGGGGDRGTSAVADLDGDGDLEIIFASGNVGSVYLHGLHHDGAPLTGFPVVFNGFANTFPVIGDVDGDGEKEIVVVARDPETAKAVLHIRNANGTLEKVIPLIGHCGAGTAPALADFDGGTVPEIIVQTDSALHVISGASGQPLPGWPQLYSGYWLGNSSPVVGDVDGGQSSEIAITLQVAGSLTDGEVRVYRKNGTLLPRFPKKLPLGAGGVPAIVDINRDGRNELIVMGDYWNGVEEIVDGVWAFDFQGKSYIKTSKWGQLGGNSRHTNSYP
jgi:hypothetical protein